MTHRWWTRPWLAAALALVAGCEDSTGPELPGPPYIAIVTKFDAGPGVDIGSTYTYHVRELSGTVGFDTLVTVTPTDTVILSVPPATYTVELEGVPSKCVSQYGNAQSLIVPAGSNTTIARYFIICQPLIRLIASVEGSNPDRQFLVRVNGAGVDRAGVLEIPDASTADTVLVEDLSAGRYQLELFNLESNCTVISPGLGRPVAEVSDSGGVDVRIRVACSDAARRPRVIAVEGTTRGGVSGVAFTATDPNQDIARYYWDVTDCHGVGVLPSGTRSMGSLMQQRTAFQDTVRVVAAFETGLLDAELSGRCAALRVVDNDGNTTPVVERPLRPSGEPAIAVERFDGRFEADLATLTVDLAVPATGFGGVFATLRLRDGSLGQQDGNQDVGIYNTVGYLDTSLPPVFVGSRFQYYDVLAVELYLFDPSGNFLLLRDEQLF